jgi:hypothetical protein
VALAEKRMSTVKVTVVWFDVDVIRIRVCVRTELFSASTVVYTTEELLRSAAEQLSGFPVGVDDNRAFELSTTNEDEASFELRCINVKGDAILISTIRNSEGFEPQQAKIVMPIFSASLDQFSTELRNMADRVASLAVLGG